MKSRTKRARSPSARRSDAVLPAEAAADGDASTGSVVGVTADSGSVSQSGVTTRSPASRRHPGRAELRAMAEYPIHPLEIFLRERRVGIARGAELLGLSERSLRDVLARRTRLSSWREADIAIDLGESVETLFPKV